jgi:hypothetical protein
MYRSLLAQYISQDVDGKYFGPDKKVHEAGGYDFYGSFSCWDTYRSQHPLLTLTAPDHGNDFIKSIVAKTKDYSWLPAQHFQNIFGEAMVGDHLIPIIVDAYMKGYRDFDVKFLYEAMRKKALESPEPPVPSFAGRSGLSYYKELGYTPYDKVTESVPNTLELAYDDWCIASLAKELARIRPEDGYFYPSSFMADNDLAVGRILHFLSRTKYWKNMLVIITEDDPQGGVDHVDAHRSVLMMAGPYVKRGYVSHTHANFGSVLKTIYNILNVPYVNQFDVTGSLLQDFFTPVPDYTPYTMELNDSRIFDAEKTMKKYNRTIDWRKIEQGPPIDNEDVERAVHYNK